jgi:hypothetical protein
MDERTASVRQDLQTDPRWQLIQRIVESPSFARASRLSDFLLFISEKALQGRGEELNEQEIGIKVFGRSADYPRSDDNIVRANATRVRQKLDEYFANTGQSERMRVSLPKGGYVPQFERVGPAPQAAVVSDLPITTITESVMEAPPDAPAPRRRMFALTVGILLLFTCVNAWILWKDYQLRPDGERSEVVHTDPRLDKLWGLLFSGGKNTLIVPGDAGLNMYTNLDKRLVDIEEYTSGSYLNTSAAAPPPGFRGGGFAARTYTSLTDLELVSQLVRLPAARGRVTIRFARYLRFDELKNGNAILMGSPNYNPWVTLFDRNLDFRLGYDGIANSMTIENKAPKSGESSKYLWSQADPNRIGYALIALTDNLQNSGKVLLLEGTTSDGVSTASDSLFNSGLMAPVISAATDQNGKLSNFEVLLKTTFYNGGALKAQVVAEHIH